VKIFLAIGTLETGIFTSEFVEGKYGKATSRMMRKIVRGRSLEQWGWKWWTRWDCERRWGTIMKWNRRTLQGG